MWGTGALAEGYRGGVNAAGIDNSKVDNGRTLARAGTKLVTQAQFEAEARQSYVFEIRACPSLWLG